MDEESGMTDLQELADLLHASSPELALTLDGPDEPGAPGWLDVSSHGRFVAVEWKPALGFGVSLVSTESDSRAGLFEGPDEVFSDIQATKDRILALLAVDERLPRRRHASAGYR
jgi:hypothetical protein